MSWMNWWDERAVRLSQSVRDEVGEYPEEKARQAAVHARQDILWWFPICPRQTTSWPAYGSR
jgi:hypothetical protein